MSEGGAALLEARGLCKGFDSPGGGRIEVLRGAELRVGAAQCVSIRGESGAGKSTLLYLISALQAADAGEIYWGGETLDRRSAGWLARRRGRLLGFVFQAYYLVPELDARENVLLAARLLGPVRAAERKRAEALLQRVGLGERAGHLPNQLSGGERQRVAIARALMNRPPLVMADEPTGNLDEETSGEVMEVLLGLCRAEGASLVLVTHDPGFAGRADRPLFLRGGVLEEA